MDKEEAFYLSQQTIDYFSIPRLDFFRNTTGSLNRDFRHLHCQGFRLYVVPNKASFERSLFAHCSKWNRSRALSLRPNPCYLFSLGMLGQCRL